MPRRKMLAKAIAFAGCLALNTLGGCSFAGYHIRIEKEDAFQTFPQVLTANESGESLNTEQGSKTVQNGSVLKYSGHYGYDSLSERQKGWYQEIVGILTAMETDRELTIEAGRTSIEEIGLEQVFQCVMMDHPEFFFVDGYSYSSVFQDEELREIRFSGTYNVTREEAQKRQAEIEQAARKILDGIPENDSHSDYEKIKYIYDTIIKQTDYDPNAPDNQNIYSVLVGKHSVCQGYSEALQYLLLKEGIECSVIHGIVDDGETHAWNLVKADGDYYYIDVTWGDVSYRNSSGIGEDDAEDFVNYDYFCITTDELLRTHTITEEIELPLCTARNDDYFVKEDLVFDSVDLDKMREVFRSALQAGTNHVAVKASDYGVYCVMYATLIDENKIFDCLDEDIKEVNYAGNEEQYTLTFWVN